MEAKNGSNKEKELEADARNALLAHFSSKSTNETAVLIGLAVAIFADFQAYDAFKFLLPWQKITFLTLSLGMLAFFVIRQLSRLISWGQVADAILIVKMQSSKETETWLGARAVKPDKIGLDFTYLARLNFSSDLRFSDCKDQWKVVPLWDRLPLLICRMTSNKYFIWAFIMLVLVVWIDSLLVAHVF
jgi:hypothetical protein